MARRFETWVDRPYGAHRTARPTETTDPRGPGVALSARRWSSEALPRFAGLIRELTVVGVVIAVAHIALAYLLIVHFGLLKGDAVARTANAYYSVWSRDPHLAAIGFIWPPLPSLLQAPLVVFPPLAASGFAGGIVSAIGAAIGAAYLLLTVRALGIGRLGSYGALAAYSLHPF
ncbi:MAG: hypothetical protein NZ518_07110, partial [Dehalococcoidia bacterium]|nr:hypothetical protein [Dehalococcoidia bacterium]